MTVMQFLEVCLPLIKQRLKMSKEEQKQTALLQAGGVPAAELTLEEQQARLEMYEGVFQEYQEMVVQFGCVCGGGGGLRVCGLCFKSTRRWWSSSGSSVCGLTLLVDAALRY